MQAEAWKKRPRSKCLDNGTEEEGSADGDGEKEPATKRCRHAPETPLEVEEVEVKVELESELESEPTPKERKEETEKKKEHHVACPDCHMGLYKTSACNDLTHCGFRGSERHVCYACGAASLPWEPHLPPTHWDRHGRTGCPQWDYDDHWNAGAAAGGAACNFLCKEQVCYSDGVECRVPEHQAGIAAMHAARRARMIQALAAEFPGRVAVTLVSCTPHTALIALTPCVAGALVDAP